MADLILTDEQREIVSLDVPKGQVLKINSFAGCAKTTTLREFTKTHPNNSFLYLVYNSSVAQEGRDTFPSNVECKTTHALAFHAIGCQYKHKFGNLKPYILTDHLNIKSYGVGKYLIDALVKFLASADSEILEKHLILDREKSQEEYRAEKDEKTTWLAKSRSTTGRFPSSSTPCRSCSQRLTRRRKSPSVISIPRTDSTSSQKKVLQINKSILNLIKYEKSLF